MLKIEIAGEEMFDELTETFIYIDPVTLELEHSLVSISAWESKWKIPFMSNKPKTVEQTLDYIKMMTLNQVPDIVYLGLKADDIARIDAYIDEQRTATWFAEKKKSGSGGQVITSELIYYWMIASNVPMECQHWHLSRLLTLIQVISEESNPNKKKMSDAEIYARNKALNEQRKQKYKTKG